MVGWWQWTSTLHSSNSVDVHKPTGSLQGTSGVYHPTKEKQNEKGESKAQENAVFHAYSLWVLQTRMEPEGKYVGWLSKNNYVNQYNKSGPDVTGTINQWKLPNRLSQPPGFN